MWQKMILLKKTVYDKLVAKVLLVAKLVLILADLF